MTYRHQAWCSTDPHTDAAKRLADIYNLHRIGLGHIECVGKWFAASLQDGSSDHELYDSKLDCVRHQKHNEANYTFVKMVPTGMQQCEAEVVLRQARNMSKHGMRLVDPDHKHGGMDLVTRLTVEDQLNQARMAVTGLVMPWEA